MSQNIFVRPAFSDEHQCVLKVRDPLSGEPLPKDGAWKSDNEFWRRRIRDKDVIDDTREVNKAKRSKHDHAEKA